MHCILAVGLVLTLITAGHTLQCMQCLDEKGNFCQGTAVTCQEPYDVCMSTLVQNEIDTSNPESLNVLQETGYTSIESYYLLRDCGLSKDCGTDVILRTPYNRMVTSRRCCQMDKCAPQTPRPIPEASQNRMTCPGCLSLKSATCEPNKAVNCRGIESQCYSYSSKNSNMSLSMCGCASQTACNMELEPDNRIQCTLQSVQGGAGERRCLPYALLAASLLLLFKLQY